MAEQSPECPRQIDLQVRRHGLDQWKDWKGPGRAESRASGRKDLLPPSDSNCTFLASKKSCSS